MRINFFLLYIGTELDLAFFIFIKVKKIINNIYNFRFLLVLTDNKNSCKIKYRGLDWTYKA